MTIPYRPLADHVLVLADKQLDRTKNGIILTEASKTGTKTGVVVAVGPGRLNEKTGRYAAMPVTVGQRVTFGEFAGRSDLPVDPEYPRGDHYKVLVAGDILAVVEACEENYLERILEAFRVLGLAEQLDLAMRDFVGGRFSLLNLPKVLAALVETKFEQELKDDLEHVTAGLQNK